MKANPSKRKIDWPTYEEVLTMKSNMSMCAIGRKLGVSDNAVKNFLQKNKPMHDGNI